jgi:hypothetical protein
MAKSANPETRHLGGICGCTEVMSHGDFLLVEHRTSNASKDADAPHTDTMHRADKSNKGTTLGAPAVLVGQ